jgi:hypothetical protein
MAPTLIMSSASPAQNDAGWNDATIIGVSFGVAMGAGVVVVICMHYFYYRKRCRRCHSSNNNQAKVYEKSLGDMKTPNRFDRSPHNTSLDNISELDATSYRCYGQQNREHSVQTTSEIMNVPSISLSQMAIAALKMSTAIMDYSWLRTGKGYMNENGMDASSFSSISSNNDDGYDPIDQHIMYSSKAGVELEFELEGSNNWLENDLLNHSSKGGTSHETNVRSPSSILQFSRLFSSQDVQKVSLDCYGDEEDEQNVFGGKYIANTRNDFTILPSRADTNDNFYKEHGIAALSFRCQSMLKGSLLFPSSSTTVDECDTYSVSDVRVTVDATTNPPCTWNNEAKYLSIV